LNRQLAPNYTRADSRLDQRKTEADHRRGNATKKGKDKDSFLEKERKNEITSLAHLTISIAAWGKQSVAPGFRWRIPKALKEGVPKFVLMNLDFID
jgi:hypothetical protein